MSADYTVFVDESFYEWFGLPKKESNLCYAAISIPTNRLADLNRFEKSIREFAFSKSSPQKRANGMPSEFKYTALQHLKPATIDEIGNKLAYFFEKNKATIFGFFVPAEGYFNYQLRSDFVEDAKALHDLSQEDYKKRVDNIREEMLKEWKVDKHNLGLLKTVYNAFFNFIVQYHGRFLKRTFFIEYDSRHPEEDVALHQAAEKFANIADRATPGAFAHYKGFTAGTSSTSAGLRLTDWIVGEIRAFFYQNASVLGGDSQLEVLSPYWNPKMILMEGNAPFYSHELSAETKNCFLKIGQGFMMPQIKKFFASGLLTYYAQYGEARHISIPQLIALDMAD